jgi:hypothetical protein
VTIDIDHKLVFLHLLSCDSDVNKITNILYLHKHIVDTAFNITCVPHVPFHYLEEKIRRNFWTLFSRPIRSIKYRLITKIIK